MTTVSFHLGGTWKIGSADFSDYIRADITINDIDVDGKYMEEINKALKIVEESEEVILQGVTQQVSDAAGIQVTDMSEWMKGMDAKIKSIIGEVKRHRKLLEKGPEFEEGSPVIPSKFD